MNIQATAAHLTRVKQPFDVLIEKGGIEQLLYSKIEPVGNIEDMLMDIIHERNPDKLIIQERIKNGSAYKYGSKTNVEIGKNEHSLNGLQSISQMNSSFMGVVPQDAKDYIIQDLRSKNDKLERSNERLEQENHELKKVNATQELELKTKDKEFELIQKANELEQTNGLGGIIEKVSQNEALSNLLGVAIGRLMGVDMNLGAAHDDQAAISQTAPLNVPEINQKVAGHITKWVYGLDENTCSHVFSLVKEISTRTNELPQIIELIKNDE